MMSKPFDEKKLETLNHAIESTATVVAGVRTLSRDAVRNLMRMSLWHLAALLGMPDRNPMEYHQGNFDRLLIQNRCGGALNMLLLGRLTSDPLLIAEAASWLGLAWMELTGTQPYPTVNTRH